jgi:hypothetical protein
MAVDPANHSKTPMQTLFDSAHLAREKVRDSLPNAAPELERIPAKRMRLLEATMSEQV